MRTVVVYISFLLSLVSAVPAAWSATDPSAADPSTANQIITVNSAGITYVTRAGDTLSSIARRLTTRQDNWVLLGKLNHIGSDTSIPIGTPITIPADLLLDDPTEAKVVAMSGSITASAPNGSPFLLGLGAKITEGMQIDTGNNSFLTLSLPDQSRISLPSNSRVRIAKLRAARYTHSPRTEILLMRGRVESKVAPLEQSKGRFDVRTPLAVAGVRGTHFRVGMNAGGTGVEVLSGHVSVGQPGHPAALILHPGQGNLTDAAMVGKPVNLLPAPQLAQAPVPQGPASAQFVLTPVAGAAGYHVQIATDQDAQNLLMEKRSNSVRMKLDGLPNGDYFARVAAVDRLGLEGSASTHAFTLAPAVAKQLALDAPYVDRNDTQQLTLKWKGAPGQKYTVQVARDLAFSWLIHSATTDATEIHLLRPPFGTYYARVQAINPDGTSTPYSLVQPFVVTDQWIIHDGNPVSARDAASAAR